MRNEPPYESSDWEQCPEGTLSKLVKNPAMPNRREMLAKVGTGTIVIATMAGVSTVFLHSDDENPQGNIGGSAIEFGQARIPKISCRKVLCLLPEYVNQKITDGKLLAQIDKHLGRCGFCTRKRDELIT